MWDSSQLPSGSELAGFPGVGNGAPNPAKIYDSTSDEGDHDLADPGSQAWTLAQEMRVTSWLVGHQITAHPHHA